MSQAKVQFDALLAELREFYRTHDLVDVKDVKPRLETLCRIIESDLSHRDEYCSRFVEIVDQLGTVDHVHRLKCDSDILDYSGRRFKWAEIGMALKDRYALFEDPNAQLEAERLIKKIFDPEWKGGRYKTIRDLNIWDWVE